RLTFCDDEIFATHRSPGDIGRAGASAAIYAMTIAQSKGRTFQHVSGPAANASTSKLHKIRLAHFSHEFTPMTRIVVAAGRRPRFHSADWGRRRGDLVIACPERSRTELLAVAATNLGLRFTGLRVSRSLRNVFLGFQSCVPAHNPASTYSL